MASYHHTQPAILVISFLVILSPLGAFCRESYVLYSGEVLNSGDSLGENNHMVVMQEDCNLVIYEDGHPIWASNTGGLARNCFCQMQADGNLVVYTPSGKPIWASNTGREGGQYVLVLQKDKNLVIYGGAIWATGTNLVNTRSRNATLSVRKMMKSNTTNNVTVNLLASV